MGWARAHNGAEAELEAILIDADAFILARKFGLLTLSTAAAMPKPTFVTTSRVARNELNALAEDVRALEEAGALRVEEIYKGSPEAKRAKELRDNEGADRGEAELLAWATSEQGRREYRFVSCDRKARSLAESLGLETGDVLDLGIHWLRLGLVSLDTLDDAFAPWEDAHPGELWRPRDFTTTKDTIRVRLAADPA